jgi:hypothetical protein
MRIEVTVLNLWQILLMSEFLAPKSLVDHYRFAIITTTEN